MIVYGVRNANKVETSGDYRELYVYQEFFHGNLPPQGQNEYGERPYKPLRLIRNLACQPVIMFPMIMMVMEKGAAERTGVVRHADFCPVVLDRVYHHPTDQAAVESVFQQCSAFDDSFTKWRDARSRAPTARETAAFDYLEVIVPNVASLRKTFQDVEPHVPVPLTSGCGPMRPMTTSAAVHERVKIVEWGGAFWMGEELFERIRPYLNEPHVYAIYRMDLCEHETGTHLVAAKY